MRKLDSLKKKVDELKPKEKSWPSFDHLSDEELELETFKLIAVDYDELKYNHPEMSDDEIWDEHEKKLIEFMEGEGEPPEKIKAMIELGKEQRPRFKAFIESRKRR